MLRAGNTAIRTREWTEVMARKFGIDAIAVSLSLDSITASVRGGGGWATATREIGPPGINAWQIGKLEELAQTRGPALTPREIAAKLVEIEFAPPSYSDTQVATAIGVASAGLAFLNSGSAVEVIAAGIGGGIGSIAAIPPSPKSICHLLIVRRYGIRALCSGRDAG